MKKLLLLPALALFLFSCSSDTEDFKALTSSSALKTAGTTPASCLSSLGAHIDIDLSNGFGNGTMTFVSETPAGISQECYKVKIVIEELSDCENLSSGTGNIKMFTTGQTYFNIGAIPPKVIGVLPSQTFSCYRWKMVFEGVSLRSSTPTCSTSTRWYEAPLF